MNRFIKSIAFGIGITLNSVTTLNASSGHDVYEISVTNLTKSQIMSPMVVSTHKRPYSLFTLGSEASPELAALAQDADNAGLISLLENAPDNREVVISDGPILPGKTIVIEVSTHRARYLTAAAMLVSSNDAFVALNGIRLNKRTLNLRAVAYDAGAENNDESCAYIPGPPCGNPGMASDVAGEGYVYVHPGIQGVGDLNSDFDWRNPVASFTIKRVRKND
ncbi:MAG: spondin domain-containing protein [Gammaproteobacteria bacterium]